MGYELGADSGGGSEVNIYILLPVALQEYSIELGDLGRMSQNQIRPHITHWWVGQTINIVLLYIDRATIRRHQLYTVYTQGNAYYCPIATTAVIRTFYGTDYHLQSRYEQISQALSTIVRYICERGDQLCGRNKYTLYGRYNGLGPLYRSYLSIVRCQQIDVMIWSRIEVNSRSLVEVCGAGSSRSNPTQVVRLYTILYSRTATCSNI